MSYSKNVAQSVYFVLLDTSGAVLTGASPSGYVSIDQSGQSALSGSFTEEGNGQYRYDATAGEFDGDEIGFLFTATDAVPVNITIRTSEDAVDLVWDELLTGSAHNTPSSAGRRLRNVAELLNIRIADAQAGGASTITLDSGASSIDDYYANTVIRLIGGTGATQSRGIVSYDGTTKVATVDESWDTEPDSTTEFQITIGRTFLAHATHTDAVIPDAETARKLLQADSYLDTTTSPYSIVMAESGTGDDASPTVLERFYCYDSNDDPVTDTTTRVTKLVAEKL